MPAVTAAPFDAVAFALAWGEVPEYQLTLKALIGAVVVFAPLNVLGYMLLYIPFLKLVRANHLSTFNLLLLIVCLGVLGGIVLGGVVVSPIMFAGGSWNIARIAATCGAMAGAASTIVWLLLNMQGFRSYAES